jgi:hypothetical protein
LFCKINNIYFYNFKYFNFIFYFNILKYFNFIFYFNILKFNNYKIQLKLADKSNKNVYKFFKKNYLLNYFNLFFLNSINKNNVRFFKTNTINYKNLINIIYNFNIKKLNYLIFDNNKYLHNLYVNMYSLKKLLIYKNYFYINPKYFTHKNFIYFYNQFLIDNNINMIIIFDLKNILNFSHILENSDIILFTFNDKFNFYENNYNLLIKNSFYNMYLYILLFNQIWLLSLNYSIYSNKILFLKNFNNFKI